MKINTKIILTIVASVFLFIASSDNGGHNGLPYGYFTLMRFVVFAISTHFAYLSYKKDKESIWVWIFGFLAILFNPFISIHFKREQWQIIDLIVGLFFIASLFLFKINKKSENL